MAAAVALSGCGAEPPYQDDNFPLAEAVATLPQAIQGGYVDEADKAVVGIVHLQGSWVSACSGTLIASNVVLTAQHCVAPVLNQVNGGVVCGTTTFGSPYTPTDLWITTETTLPYNPSAYVQGQEVRVVPGGNEFCGRDIAVIILQTPIDPAEAQPMIPRVDTQIAYPDEYYAVGYGQTSDGDPNSSGTRHRRDGLYVGCVGSGCPTFDFAIKEEEWQGDAGVCSGDSGGPAADLLDRVTGVASRGATNCSFPVYGSVYGWGQWIKDTIVYASTLIGAEPPPWATGFPTDPVYTASVGDQCISPELCPGGVCYDDYCTRPCQEQAPCPEGYECGEDGFCAEIPEPPPPQEEEPTTNKKQVTTTACGCRVVAPTGSAGAYGLLGLTLLGLFAARRRRPE